MDHPDQKAARRQPRCPHSSSDAVHARTPARRSSFISGTRSCVFMPRMPSLATKTTSFASPVSGPISRHAARRMRLARFRSTAPPTLRDATTESPPCPGAMNSTTRFPCDGVPFRKTRWTSLARKDAGQAVSRARPLRRRRAMIARPARVRMRRRKPCVFARRRLFGWNVRLPLAMSGDPRSMRRPAGRRPNESIRARIGAGQRP
jgi:hypothetical protein